MKRSSQRTVTVSDLKARCLGLVEEVASRGTEYIVTKHGRPVARLVPYGTAHRPIKAMWKGQVKIVGDIVHCDWSDEFDATRDS